MEFKDEAITIIIIFSQEEVVLTKIVMSLLKWLANQTMRDSETLLNMGLIGT